TTIIFSPQKLIAGSGSAGVSPASGTTTRNPAGRRDFGLLRHVSALKNGDMSPHSKYGILSSNRLAGSLAQHIRVHRYPSVVKFFASLRLFLLKHQFITFCRDLDFIAPHSLKLRR